MLTASKKGKLPVIKTDFSHVERLILIYPADVGEGDYDYNILVPFYDQLIDVVPPDIHVIVFVKSRRIGQKIKARRKNLDYIIHKDLLTIWLRDVGGFNCTDRIIKPVFRPLYYHDAMERAARINTNMELIHSVLGKELVRVPLVWDGGNLVTNGRIGVITRRIFRDNPDLSEKKIAGIIQDYLGIDPVFIPEPRNDPLGHADGSVAFVHASLALLSDYPEQGCEYDRKYVEGIRLKLLKRGVEVTNSPSYVENKCFYETTCSPAIPSARGLYVNFLRLNDTFLLPYYSGKPTGLSIDYNEENRRLLERFGNVVTINCDELAKFGGVLRCISPTE
jgi:agmatine/peptidylarginine deiminase